MKEKFKEEYGKFARILNTADERLATLILSDIMSKFIKVSELDENQQVTIDYSDFDRLIDDIKKMFNQSLVFQPEIESLSESIRNTLDNNDRTNNECKYAMRTLAWVLEEINDENKEEKDNA